MTLRPEVPMDMLLAPVAAEIDQNLQRLRDTPTVEIEAALQLELDSRLLHNERAERADRVLTAGLRNVNLHGWKASITDDGSRMHLSGGSVTIDLGLGASVTAYIESGP